MTAKRYLVAFLAATSAFGLAIPAIADIGDAWSAYHSGDYGSAYQEFARLAEAGDAASQNNLGHMYDEGLGVEQSYVAAVRWYRLAAKQNVAEAQFNLGVKYDQGQGVLQDHAKAAKLYHMAAQHDYARAMTNLGFLYYLGRGVTQDLIRAHMWFNLAAVRGHGLGKKNLANISELMTPAQIAEAQKLARKWKPTRG